MTRAEDVATYPTKAISADALSSLFQAVAGLRNFRAATAMLTCFGLSVVIPGLIWLLLGKGAAGISLGALVAAFMIASGIHAGGLLLMDQAKQVQMRSISEAIFLGMWCVPKSIMLAIGLALAVIAVYVLMALLFYVCKIPGLGPLLYAIVFPVGVLVAGLTFTALFLGMMLALSAMWEGATITAALVKAFAALRIKLVETVLMSFVVLLLAGFVFFFVSGVLMTGFLPAVGMSASILGATPQMFGSLASSMMGMGGSGSSGGYLLAGSFGSGLLFALTMTLVFQVWLLGINLVFLKVTDGLDASATEAALQSGLAEVRRKAADIGSKAKQAAEHARVQASQAVERTKASSVEAVSTATAVTSAPIQRAEPAGAADGRTPQLELTCPACTEEVSSDDLFCGACGHRLKT